MPDSTRSGANPNKGNVATAEPTRKRLLNARLTIEATVMDSPLIMRNAMASADLERDGVRYNIDLTSNVAGDGVYVQVKQDGGDGWITYQIDAETLMRAAFDHFIAQHPTAARPRPVVGL